MEKHLYTLMLLVDCANNYHNGEKYQAAGRKAARYYKEYLEYSLYTRGYNPNPSIALFAKKQVEEANEILGLNISF